LAEIAVNEADGKPLEIWFADEARIGQKNKITRRWARRGTRPSAPRDLRTASTYIFGAICPAEGKAAGLVLPRCTTEAMTLHLVEISQAVAPGAHAVLLLDQAGWHVSRKLKVPSNITLLPLPAKAPELNPVENIWQYLRENWLSNRIFTSYTDILDHCCAAWNKLVEQPWTIMSIGLRDWANAWASAAIGIRGLKCMIGEGYVHTVNRIFGLTVFSAIVALTVPAAQADNDAY
jgi:transposase